MKELFFEQQFLNHFQKHWSAPSEKPPVTELVQPDKANGHAVEAGN